MICLDYLDCCYNVHKMLQIEQWLAYTPVCKSFVLQEKGSLSMVCKVSMIQRLWTRGTWCTIQKREKVCVAAAPAHHWLYRNTWLVIHYTDACAEYEYFRIFPSLIRWISTAVLISDSVYSLAKVRHPLFSQGKWWGIFPSLHTTSSSKFTKKNLFFLRYLLWMLFLS